MTLSPVSTLGDGRRNIPQYCRCLYIFEKVYVICVKDKSFMNFAVNIA